MKKVIVILLISSLNSCFSIEESDVLIKSIKTDNYTIDLYRIHSLLTSFPREFIVVKKGNLKDTICISSNINDIETVGKDSIKIGFYGSPLDNVERLEIPDRIHELTIVKDTSCVMEFKKQIQ